MNKVKLYGQLATVYGEEFELDCFSPSDMFKALAYQLPNFLTRIRQEHYVMVRELPNGQLATTKEALFLGMSNTTVHILPLAEGASSKGVGKMILGVGLIAASIIIPGAMTATLFGIAGAMSYGAVGIALGLSLLLGGAAMLLAPTPKMGNDDTKDDNSFLFSGDVNTAAQGIAVPLTYGRDRVKPIPIATQIVTNQMTIGGGGFAGSGILKTIVSVAARNVIDGTVNPTAPSGHTQAPPEPAEGDGTKSTTGSPTTGGALGTGFVNPTGGDFTGTTATPEDYQLRKYWDFEGGDL
jgi:predicted phage tail protein